MAFINHTAAEELIPLLARVSSRDPTLRVEVRIGASSEMLDVYNAGEPDAAFTRRDAERLFVEHCGWFAAPQWSPNPDGAALRNANTRF